ncbi:MAG TPA: transglutaminase domain-containing protein [Acidiferrobacterales bacterium]|jgi:transglutaminase-like putative cysteine protease
MERTARTASGNPRHLAAGALLAVLGCALPADANTPAGPVERTVEFVYAVQIEPPPPGSGPIDVYLPIASDGPNQDVLEFRIDAGIPGKLKTEARYGNRYWHGRLAAPAGEPIGIAVHYRVRRSQFEQDRLGRGARALSAAERRRLAPFLQPSKLVPVDHPIVNRVLADIDPPRDAPLAQARAIYDYVVDNMEYKKVGSGWGNGDTFWACSEKYGNCTDFHALFISLARTQGIPARFEMGVPLPDDRGAGTVGGYHCWVQFHLGGVGWFPIDASEARKHPGKRELLFGTQPADRILFSIERDLDLGQKSGPLNYFIYPHVEVNGARYDAVRTEFRYRDIPVTTPAVIGGL